MSHQDELFECWEKVVGDEQYEDTRGWTFMT